MTVRREKTDAAFGSPEPPEPGAQAEEALPVIEAKVDRRPAEIDGFTVTRTTANFLRDHPGAEFVGIHALREARTIIDGRPTPWVQFDPRVHRGWSTRLRIREFCRVPNNGHNLSEIWLSEYGGEPKCIGHRLALNVLVEMMGKCMLSHAGLQLYQEQTGNKSETLTEATTCN